MWAIWSVLKKDIFRAFLSKPVLISGAVHLFRGLPTDSRVCLETRPCFSTCVIAVSGRAHSHCIIYLDKTHLLFNDLVHIKSAEINSIADFLLLSDVSVRYLLRKCSGYNVTLITGVEA